MTKEEIIEYLKECSSEELDEILEWILTNR